jgi:hypothetical protein
MHPDKLIDVALLGPTRPGDRSVHDDRQRYAEFTWNSVPALLYSEFPKYAATCSPKIQSLQRALP